MARRGFSGPGRMRARISLPAGLIAGLFAAAAASQEPREAVASRASALDCPTPQVLVSPRLVEVSLANSRIIDVQYGFGGFFVATDGQQDRVIELDATGNVKSSVNLGLFAFNLFPVNGKTYFSAFDANSRSLVGFLAGSKVTSQLLPGGFLNQGSALAVRPDEEFGIIVSGFLSELQTFRKELVLATPSVVTSPGKAATVAVAPWDGSFLVGYTSSQGASGLGTFQANGTVTPLVSLPAAANVLVPCGDWLFVGGVKLLARVKVSDGGITMEVTPIPFDIYGASCWQDESVVFVGQGRRFGVDYRSGVTQIFTAGGTGNLLGVATAPGGAPNAMFLNVFNNVGSLISAQLPYQAPADRNSVTGCRVGEFSLSIINKF